VLALNDVRAAALREECRALESELDQASCVDVGGPMPDLGAYREAASRIDAQTICFLNSYSRPLDPAWLRKLADHLAAPAVGIVGASGSYESFSTHAPFVTKPFRRRQFPLFPNPHIRTNSFMLSRELLLSLEWGRLSGKIDTWKLESGHRSLSRQVWGEGLEALVVGRDGRAFERGRFYESNTFRRGSQPNLMISDNRAREFDEAEPGRRRWLFELAWGERALDTDDPDQPWIGPAVRLERARA
jgi:hypothetical protein